MHDEAIERQAISDEQLLALNELLGGQTDAQAINYLLDMHKAAENHADALGL
jgi:hypothetical protein